MIAGVPSRLSIGEFSRVSHLSIKTLRHYDEAALLEPAHIDASTGYRYYETSQLPQAQIIRRLRALDMPVPEVKAVLGATNAAGRNALIARHLERLELELSKTRQAVESVRALLRAPASESKISRRSVPATAGLAIRAVVAREDLPAWWQGALGELHATLRARALRALGPLGGIYDAKLFEDDRGEATVYAPVESVPAATLVGRLTRIQVPAAELAVLVHAGSHADLDVTYGQLAQHVATHELGIAGPIRELYVRDPVEHPDSADWLTEIGWPIFRADAG